MLPKRRLWKAKRTVGCHYVPVLKERARLPVLKDSLPNPAWVSLGNVFPTWIMIAMMCLVENHRMMIA